MTNQEIHEEIVKIDEEIGQLFDPTTFVLNKKVKELRDEKFQLQSLCNHEIEEGRCKWCGKVVQ